jgi:hypothetical protein
MFSEYKRKPFRITVFYQYLLIYLILGSLMKLSVAELSTVDLPVFILSSCHRWRQEQTILPPSENIGNLLLDYTTSNPRRYTRKKYSYPCNRPWRPIRLWDVEAPKFSNNRLTNGGEVVSLTRRPPFSLQEDSWYSLLLGAESTTGP